jgi:hypothetical protein
MMTGWDATELQNYKLQDGTTFATIVNELNVALNGVSNELYNDPLWSKLVSYTDQPEMEYRVGSSNGMDAFTEYGRPDPKRAATEGHMLPLRAFDRALGWTWDYLRKARMSQIEADIADAVKDVRDKWRVQILTRLLQNGDDSGAALGLGSGGYSPGFATTASATNVDFTPPAFGGTSFASTHEHYNTGTGGAMTLAMFQAMRDDLREHGHQPPYEFIAGTADETAIKALDDFIEVARMGVNYGAMQDVAIGNRMMDSSGNWFIGMIEDFAVRIVPGMPQYYGFGWKTYGANSQRNPLRIRVQKDAPLRPNIMAFPDPRSGAGAAFPLQWVMFFLEFGVGVGDRTNGVALYNNNSTWADGTPT